MTEPTDREKAREWLFANSPCSGDGPTFTDSDVDLLAEFRTEAREQGRREMLEKAVDVCRIHEERIVHTRHRDGIGMGSQCCESEVRECRERIRALADEQEVSERTPSVGSREK